MNVSKESQEFLENLRVYLISSGKNELEIEGIIGELEDHLHEAEKNGKNIDDVIGMTPKEYMSQLANEMPFDLMGVLKYLPIIFLGAFSYIVLGDAVGEGINLSLLELAGYPIILLFIISLTFISFKYIASNKLSKAKEWSIFGILGLIPILLFIGLVYLNGIFDTPTIHFGTAANYITIIISILVFIGLAIWAKTWMPIILPIILFLPEPLINMTDLAENTKLILSGISIPLLFGIYLLIFLRMEKKKDLSKHGE